MLAGGCVYHLSQAALSSALDHLCRYGDTDIFPPLPELAFFRDAKAAVVAELASLDLDTYSPAGAVEALSPKGRVGFRLAHQLPPTDALLWLAAAVEIGPAIEALRLPGAFSNRFAPAGNGELFEAGRSYRDWQESKAQYLHVLESGHVAATDISDFFPRVNFHRLENLLDEAAPGHGAARFIKKHLKVIRAKQSFGLPVGGTAARLLAELALCDIDRALQDQGITASRFVDDFRLFMPDAQSAYDALAFLAEHLGVNEGLSLNSSKTFIITGGDYFDNLLDESIDVDEEAATEAFDNLIDDVYSGDPAVDPQALEALKALNLVAYLSAELEKESWDVGRIRRIMFALSMTKQPGTVEYVNGNLDKLVMFAKELCVLMTRLAVDVPGAFQPAADQIVAAILSPPATSIQVIQSWLLELLVRGVITPTTQQIKALEALPHPLSRRQLMLIRGRTGDRNYFRKQKTALDLFSKFEQSCLVWGAACLPADEFSSWLTAAKPSFTQPLGSLYLKWLKEHASGLADKLANDWDHVDIGN